MSPDGPDMTAPTALPINCPICGRPVRLQYVPDGSQWATQHVWACPSIECRQMNVIRLSGGSPVVTTDVFRKD